MSLQHPLLRQEALKGLPWQAVAVRRRVLASNRDFLIVFCGTKGSCKSYSCMRFLEVCDPTFNIDRITFTAKGFIELIRSDLPHGSAIMWDEPGVEFNSRTFWSIVNKIINDHLLLMRTKRYIVGLAVPEISMIDSQGRSHIVSYVECLGYDKKEDAAKTKFFRVQKNARSGKIYFKYYFDPEGVREVITWFNRPSRTLTKEYEERRAAFFQKTSDDDIELLDAYTQKEREKMGMDSDKEAVADIVENYELYIKEYRGRRNIDQYTIMDKKKVGAQRARKIKSSVTTILKGKGVRLDS